MERNSFLIIAKEVVADKTISATAKLLFAQLCDHRNKRTGQCNPWEGTLAVKIGVSRRTVIRGVKELKRAGLIEPQRTQQGNQYEFPKCQNGTSQVPKRHSAECQSVTWGPAVSLLTEPYLIEPKEGTADAAGFVTTPTGAAAAGTTTSCITAKTPEKTQDGRPQEEPLSQGASARRAEPVLERSGLPPMPPVRECATREMAEGLPATGSAAAALCDELNAEHPEPGNLPKASSEVEKILATGVAVEAIRASHAAWCAHWAGYVQGRFIPQLWRWIRDGDWKHPPVPRKESRRETIVEQRKRESQEAEDSLYRTYAELGAWEAIRSYGGDEAVEVWREKIKAAS